MMAEHPEHSAQPQPPVPVLVPHQPALELQDLYAEIPVAPHPGSSVTWVVHVTHQGKNWIIRKRFSDFTKLHKQMSADFKHLPALPPTHFLLSTNTNKMLLEERRRALNVFMKELLAVKYFTDSKALQDFFEIGYPHADPALIEAHAAALEAEHQHQIEEKEKKEEADSEDLVCAYAGAMRMGHVLAVRGHHHHPNTPPQTRNR